MKRLAIISALAVLVGALYGVAFAAAPVPTPPDNASAYHQFHTTTTPEDTTVAADADACTTPEDADCTSILTATNIIGWLNVAIWVKNTDASDTIETVSFEASPTGGSATWVELASGSCDSLVAGGVCVMALDGAYAYVRVKARASANASTSVWITAKR